MNALLGRISFKLAAGILCALMLALLIHDRGRWKAKSAEYSQLLAAERSAHSATVANYRAAAEQARRQDIENLTRVKADQAAINERTADDFESRIATARASALRLRDRASSAASNPGGGGATSVPGISAASQGAFEAAGEDGLPRSDSLIATEQAIQLDELIKWIRQQNDVRVNGPEK